MTSTASTTGQTDLLATFFVRETLCALDAASVQEVIRVGPVTPVHFAPEEVLGIFNLRGRIVTIVDIGQLLGFPAALPGPDSRIFIVEDCGEFIGMLVDRVDEVVEVESDQWQPPPANVNRGQGRFFKGVCRSGGRVITLLNGGQLLAESGH
jgi:purine-binding chemotaxis protein CheW